MNALVIGNKVRKIPGGFVETVISPLKHKGFDIIWAANFSELKIDKSELPCRILETTSETNPFSVGSIKTYRTICNFLKHNDVDLIFCSTPIGGLIGRICGKKFKINTIIYQAHGFLFFKGGPKLGFVYKLLEKCLAHYTDAIITINKEDYSNASRFVLRNNSRNVFMVNGSGANYTSVNLSSQEKIKIRNELGLTESDFVLISIGELNKNKNVINSVRAVHDALKYAPNLKMVICGEGRQSIKIKKYIERHNLGMNIFLLGYRTDVKQLIAVSNCYISTSFREGLSRTVGESLAAGLPCIVSDKRGLRDWIDGENGFLINPKNVSSISAAIISVAKTTNYKKYKEYGLKKIKEYSSEYVSKQMNELLDIILTEKA